MEDAGLLYRGVMPNTVESLTFNFKFLKQYDPIFYKLASEVELFSTLNPTTTMLKLRQLAEALAKDIASSSYWTPE